jgi:predicted secreted Zn-dependent protease
MADGSGGELVWYQDERCESGACVEVAADEGIVLLRSSRDQRAMPVALSRNEWQEFLAGVKDGAFDRV